MPSTPYDLVQDDQDLRVPLHAEQAFFQGITFQAKFIGWEEVPRPNTRAEIVQAMRRIRYECKVQNLKKRKVIINISVNGVRVLLKKRRRKKKQWSSEPEEIELMNHPIYRIFYVSHDSSDLKIFSYIARDASNDTFKCSVFKSNKKSQAMRVVRTIGQAFEVCHKFNLQKNSLDNNDERSDLSSELFDTERIQEQLSDDELSKKDQPDLTSDRDRPMPQRPNHLELVPLQDNISKSPCNDGDKSPTSPLSSSKEVQTLREQLEQQALQTRQALAQLMLVREQLISETNARLEAQARTQQLLQQNRELLEHLASLGAYTEPPQPGLTSANIGLAPQSHLHHLLLQDQSSDLSVPIRKAYLSSHNNSNLATINQQINSLGSINQQLTTLSHQLSGLNQQSQNLQNFQNLAANVVVSQAQPHPQPTPSPTPPHRSSLQHSPPAGNNNNNQFPTLNQLQNISNQLTNISTPNNPHQDALSKELFQVNQELLNRLQSLNLGIGASANNVNGGGQNMNNNHSPAFFYVNPMSCSPNNNTNYNFLSSPSSMGNLTPSPMGTMNRNSFSNSPINDELAMSIDKNLNSFEDGVYHQSRTGGSSGAIGGHQGESNRSDSSSSPSQRGASDQRLNVPGTVMLKVTDEAGNVTNTRKLSATPSFITRSTSEKVPNRSQIMSQVQRTAWARHTTK